MGSWIWIVVFVGLFLLMHRSGMGCCGGHSHRPGESKKEPDGADKVAKDSEESCH